MWHDSGPGAREGETVKEETGSKTEASLASLGTPSVRVSYILYALSGLQHFQTFSVQDEGSIVAVAGPCGAAWELGGRAGILLARAASAVGLQPSLFMQTVGHGEQKGHSCSSISLLADLTDRGGVHTTRGLTACSCQGLVYKLGVSRSHCAFLMYTATRCCLCRACRAVKGTELWEQKEWKITEHFHLQIYCVLLSRSLNACANEQRGHNICIRMK